LKPVESLEDELSLVLRVHGVRGSARYDLLGRYVLFIYQTYLAFSYFCQQACLVLPLPFEILLLDWIDPGELFWSAFKCLTDLRLFLLGVPIRPGHFIPLMMIVFQIIFFNDRVHKRIVFLCAFFFCQ
jgi:hypothetical protein